MASTNYAIAGTATPNPPTAPMLVAERLRSAERARKRVLFLITTTGIGGTETVLLQLARALPGHGIDPIVCSLCPPGRIGREISSLGIDVVDLGMSEQPSTTEVISGIGGTARLIDRRGIALMQTLMSRAHVVGVAAARLSRMRPIVVSSARSLTPAGARLTPALVRWTRKLAAKTVAVSEAVRAELLSEGAVEPSRIVVIRNGVDAQRFTAVDAARARAALGVPGDGLVVGAAGRLARVKGFDVLLSALARVRRSGVGALLTIAGDGPEREALQLRAARLGIAASVRFLGGRRDVVNVYSASDVVVLPSRQEGSPNALLEAMSCGRATVSAAVGGVPELVEHGRSGLLVGANDADALAAGIRRLLSDAGERRRMGEAARQRVLDHFDVRTTIHEHAELYHSLIERETSRHRTS
jgi:glycosyltransferase involved in cell wall biosynthesis